MHPDLRRQFVFSALNSGLKNAKENGYSLHMLTFREIAEDMAEYDADLEGESIEGMMQHIAEWMDLEQTSELRFE